MENEFLEFVKNLKKRIGLIIYALLAFVVYIAVWIRTRNVSGLRDITTGGWTLGPDLDPFLFLRWAKYIVENGSLFVVDTMRYVPFGFETSLEFPLLHHSIAWFHNLATMFGSVSVEQSAVYFPVFMFALTVIAFFLMTKTAFSYITDKRQAGIAAIVASFFFSVIPSFLPRTIAGIPEKEAEAFFFFFMAFFFFLLSWKEEKRNKQFIFAGLGGVFAGLMALTWGGYAYVQLIISTVVMIMFLFGQINLRRTISYYIFLVVTFIIAFLFFERFSFSALINSLEGAITLFVVIILLADSIIHRYLLKYIPSFLKNSPRMVSIIYGGIFTIFIGTISFGSSFIIRQIKTLYTQLISPPTSRLIQTVAENRQPFFAEWASQYGPILLKFPLLLLLGFIASAVILYVGLKNTPLIRRQKAVLISAWLAVILAITYTRYSPTSLFNGSNFLSVFLYFIATVFMIVAFIHISKQFSKSKIFNIYNTVPFGVIFTLVFFVISLVSARASIRLVLMLVPIVSMLVAYLFVKSSIYIYKTISEKRAWGIAIVLAILVVILTIFTAYVNYSNSKNLAQNYVPSAYNQQWQKAMSWTRENTPINSVFGHWWDYGYWVQSIGERATMLDGGNFLGYWNHLMGRHGLTETDFSKTLEFLYAHNITHFLIDSTDIGKYTAFSTIGSDPNYDRRSWIPTFIRDNSQTTERKNATVFVYPGGAPIDEDIRYNLNGTDLFLPEGKAYVAAVVVSVNSLGSISEVYGIYFLQDKTYQIPLRYYWDKETGLVDTKKGIDAGIFLYPKIVANAQGGGDIEPRGALLYLSSRTVHSNLARFYLFGEDNPNFKLAHNEPDALVSIINSQGADAGDFVYYNELRGPIKIWELDYPSNIIFDKKYLQTEYPDDILFA